MKYSDLYKVLCKLDELIINHKDIFTVNNEEMNPKEVIEKLDKIIYQWKVSGLR